ncbi:hypothetical protein ACFC00_23945 [Streptomyces adustus]|uniref:hypothetical protein n=1 Tax=Streptomyces adustus TaxID=1609272 RepID=UPI0035DE1255
MGVPIMTAPLSIIVPNIRGYDFGIGVDRLSGAPMNQVVESVPSLPVSAGAVQSFDVSRIHTTRDLQESLGISIEASYGCATFGSGASGRFSYLQESQIQSSCLFMTVSSTAHLADLSIDDSVMTKRAQEIAGRQDVFTARYGDMFCRACSRGGLFVGVMRIEANSSAEATNIEGELSGGYGFFSADSQSNFRNTLAQHKVSVYCRLYTEGGPSLEIHDPSDPAELLDHANAWSRSLQSDPNTFSKPYEWTLSSISIAEGPSPANEAQIQHAQDVLQFCARQRVALFDQLNLLTWIQDHPERFDWASAVSRDIIQEATSSTQNDVDLVAKCASAAINDPATAVMPNAYAATQDPPSHYPSGSLPSPLPSPLQPSETPEVTAAAGTGTGSGVPDDTIEYETWVGPR